MKKKYWLCGLSIWMGISFICQANVSKAGESRFHNAQNVTSETQQTAMIEKYQREETEYEWQMHWVDELVIVEDYAVMAGWNYSEERNSTGFHTREKWFFFSS